MIPIQRESRFPPSAAALLFLALLSVNGSYAHTVHDDHSLGTVDFPISCSAPAQEQFNRAMALLHHMTYPQAREAFEAIIASHPECAMAYWGVSMTLFQPLWPTRPSPAALAQGWSSVQKAKELQRTPREALFIASAEAFFTDPTATDYWQRIRRWEAASRKAYEQLPGDTEAALFYALAHLATTPANTISREHADASAAILADVYARHPDHPGAMHYLVHANDVPGREREFLEVTRKYERIAPNNPHALHMPTHIYTRLGDWDGSIKGNLRAADASLLHRAGPNGEYVWDEYAHAIEYLIYAYLQQGADKQAAAQLQRLQAAKDIEPTFKSAFHLASTQSRYALERHDWPAAERIQPRTPASLDWDRFPWAEAIAVFARGLGAAHLDKTAETQAAIDRLQTLETSARQSGEDLFARSIQVLRLELTAWSTHERGDQARSIELMREAAALEASTPKHAVTPGPTLPANELLGDLCLALKKPAQARSAYEASLKAYPNRFNSLLGASRAAREMGDVAAAKEYEERLREVAENGDRLSELSPRS